MEYILSDLLGRGPTAFFYKTDSPLQLHVTTITGTWRGVAPDNTFVYYRRDYFDERPREASTAPEKIVPVLTLTPELSQVLQTRGIDPVTLDTSPIVKPTLPEPLRGPTLFREILRRIIKDPSTYCQRAFHSEPGSSLRCFRREVDTCPDRRIDTCGTAHCIAGWAQALSGNSEPQLGVDIVRLACNLLEIPKSSQAAGHPLFDEDSTPLNIIMAAASFKLLDPKSASDVNLSRAFLEATRVRP